jgi:hypothetical protein
MKDMSDSDDIFGDQIAGSYGMQERIMGREMYEAQMKAQAESSARADVLTAAAASLDKAKAAFWSMATRALFTATVIGAIAFLVKVISE